METTINHAYDLACAADLIKCAQVTTDYQIPACKLAGPLVGAVTNVFPGHLLAVYLLTDVSRRQVWNAYLASPRIAPQMSSLSGGDVAELRASLLTCRSAELIEAGYGSSERGLIGLYGKLGPEALSPEFYVSFHATLSTNEALRRTLSHAPAIDTKALSLLFSFPTQLQSYALARQLIEIADPMRFLELHDCIQRQCFPGKQALMERLYRLIRVGKGFRAALKDIYHALSFPTQVVPDGAKLRFIPNGSELIKIAERYRNCLKDHLWDAFSGESQFYEWSCPSPAMICLKRHRGNTWWISAMSLKDNVEPSKELQCEIRTHFAPYEIGERRCIADLFDQFLEEPTNMSHELAVLEAMRRG
ncbi:hypothetical protein [Aestuariivirga sp.]|uniref:hypothetical protein n=1 Tax=Aestuariivirga sp. TaxID=2650926 RepID=UPI003BA98A52